MPSISDRTDSPTLASESATTAKSPSSSTTGLDPAAGPKRRRVAIEETSPDPNPKNEPPLADQTQSLTQLVCPFSPPPETIDHEKDALENLICIQRRKIWHLEEELLACYNTIDDQNRREAAHRHELKTEQFWQADNHRLRKQRNIAQETCIAYKKQCVQLQNKNSELQTEVDVAYRECVRAKALAIEGQVIIRDLVQAATGSQASRDKSFESGGQ